MPPSLRNFSRTRITGLAFAVGALSWTPLAAAEDTCPEGDWFCEPARPEPPPAETPPPAAEPEAGKAPPPEFELPPTPMMRGRGIDLGPPPPPHRLRRPHLRWAFGAHVFGALLGGHDAASDASFGGVGAGLRYRFYPEFALQTDLEFGFGTDYNGNDRQEAAALVNAVGVFNPRSAVRGYAFGGIGLGLASVTDRRTNVAPIWSANDRHYSYFGFDLGVGLEVRVAPRTAIHADVVGFLRDRTDADRRAYPEFVDPHSGRTSNTSVGSLVRIGALFFF